MSEHISVTRLVDRFLEHGRIFIFHNKGNPKVYAGSADWMNRNIYHRVEVCFPVHDDGIRQELIGMLHHQLADNVKAVTLDNRMNNQEVKRSEGEPPLRAQQLIYESL
jgi:polyphosphate kinase